MRPTLDQRWLDHFRACGYPDATGIATGMEGAVYSLVPGELVAKVWSRRSIDSLRRLEAFYERLASTNGRLRTPRILDVDIVDGVAVSKEMFLAGVPLERHLTQTAKSADLRAVDATAEVLQFLRDIGEADEFRDVFVLDETQLAWNGAACWSDAIGQLLHRRLARFGDQLEPVVPYLDEVLEATLAFLQTRDDIEMSVIHGDLCPANVMVDDTLDPVAVLDFGFLSTVGDPAFDASIASAIFNMYGPNARADVTRFLLWPTHESIEETKAFLKGCEAAESARVSRFPWVLTRAQDPAKAPVGMLELNVDAHSVSVGYVISPGCQGEGFATEALAHVVDVALAKPRIWRVWASTDVENTASVRVMEKAGMEREGRLRRYVVRPQLSEEPWDAYVYSAVRDEP